MLQAVNCKSTSLQAAVITYFQKRNERAKRYDNETNNRATMEKLEIKRIGDIMYCNTGLKDRCVHYVGHTVLERVPKIVKYLTEGGFNVSLDVIWECLTAKLPPQEIDIKGDEYPVTPAEAAAVVWPTLDEQTKQRIKGLNEFMVQSATNELNAVKAKALGVAFQMGFYFGRKYGNATDEMGIIRQLIEYKDGKLQWIDGYLAKADELVAVRFKTQAAVDIYNQHVKVYGEMQKLYGLIRNNFVKQTQCYPNVFIEFDFGKIGFPEALDYELLAKKSGI